VKPNLLSPAILAIALALTACQDAPLAPDAAEKPAAPIPMGPPSGEVRTGWIYGPDGKPAEVTFTVFEGWALFEGDINLGRADKIAKTREELAPTAGPRYGVFINGSTYRWPSGVMPYVIDPSFDPLQQQTILDAMSHIVNTVGGVKFKPRTTESNYVVFLVHPSVCNSPPGRQGGGQVINLTSGCAYNMGKVAHEILHSAGMWHEQSRCDRDSYVSINLNNVLSKDHHNFDKKCPWAHSSVFEYSEGSIMHYGAYDGSYNGQPVITSKRGLGHLMGQRTGLAQSDVNTLNYIYRPWVPQNLDIVNSNGDAVVTWNPSSGATHYTMTYIQRYEYRDNYAGTSYTTEQRLGPGTIYGTTTSLGPYTGKTSCVAYDDGYVQEIYTYEFELQAHFPEGITSYAGAWASPTGDC
jgi:astacin